MPVAATSTLPSARTSARSAGANVGPSGLEVEPEVPDVCVSGRVDHHVVAVPGRDRAEVGMHDEFAIVLPLARRQTWRFVIATASRVPSGIHPSPDGRSSRSPNSIVRSPSVVTE